MQNLIVANTNNEQSLGLLQALGIDWKLLIEQTIAFLILLFILSKFVYPVLIKAIDSRRQQIEAGLEEAKASREALEKAEAKVEALLAQARKDADEIVARSHQEAGAMVADAETKAAQRAEQIVTDARSQLERDITKARETLKAETVQLVAAATEHIVGEKLDQKKDAALISKALDNKAQGA
ncbi:MAG TPA: F0F1 ATP synthase subunit B [Candidatus Saccharimonadales bacterium]|nr:F0F1 ATP synthase subunit B [Candidatus Saccharimonadales bacterium]